MDMIEVIEYDPEADILFIKLRPGRPQDEKLLDSDIVLGVDEKGEPLYIEVWDASKRGLAKALMKLAHAKRKRYEAQAASPGARHPRAHP